MLLGEDNNKITLIQFREQLLDILEERLNCYGGITTKVIRKNNGVILEGIFLNRAGDSISPAFYVENLYDSYIKGASIISIADDVSNQYQKDCTHLKGMVDFYKDFECVKNRVLYRIINYNDNEQFLQNVPYRKYLDFAVIYYCKIENSHIGKGNITVYNEHISMWDVKEEQLYKYALHNTPKLLPEYIINIENIMSDMLDECEFSIKECTDQCTEIYNINETATENILYVLTNGENYYGACVMLYKNVLNKFAHQMNKNFYILPSSVHEVLLLPVEDKEDEETDELKNMVRMVNDTQVELEERLSYNVYYYNRFKDKISIV